MGWKLRLSDLCATLASISTAQPALESLVNLRQTEGAHNLSRAWQRIRLPEKGVLMFSFLAAFLSIFSVAATKEPVIVILD